MNVDRAELLRVLDAVSPGIGKAAKEVTFSGGRATTFNEDLFVSVPSPCLEGLDIAVEHEVLTKALNGHKDATIRLKQSGGYVGIGSIDGKWKARLREHPSSPVYSTLAMPGRDDWVTPDGSWADAVEVVGRAASTDKNASFMLRCVNICPDRCEAFDYSQYARAAVRSGLNEPVLVEWSLLRAIKGMGVTHIARTRGFLHLLTAAGAHIGIRSVVAAYPNLSQLTVGLEHARPFQLPVNMADAAKVVTSILTTDRPIKVVLADSKLRVVTEDDNGQGYSREQDIVYTGPPLTFYIHKDQLKDIATWGAVKILEDPNGGKTRIIWEDGHCLVMAFTEPTCA